MKIKCISYFNKENVSVKNLFSSMSDIESGKVEHSEIEVQLKGAVLGGEFLVQALFQSGESKVKGWFVTAYDKVNKENMVLCLGDDGIYEEVLISGCPSLISLQAILTEYEVIELMKRLCEGVDISPFPFRIEGDVGYC
ncbi:hypothetical protein [Microbulbifer sp. TRSA007]|uniref:hypothetical protein n=1 Tax=Microbulbifer sp. TRSA007 TaxID=3243384 RepID=UPI0040392180